MNRTVSEQEQLKECHKIIAQFIEDIFLDRLRRSSGGSLESGDKKQLRSILEPLIVMPKRPHHCQVQILRSMYWGQRVELEKLLALYNERDSGAFHALLRWIKERDQAVGAGLDEELRAVALYIALWLVPPQQVASELPSPAYVATRWPPLHEIFS